MPTIAAVHPVFDSHTYGLQVVTIDDTWVFTSDASYSFENFGPEGTFDSYSPVGFGVGSLTEMVNSLDTIRRLSHDRLDRLIIPHDQAMWRRFPTVEKSGGMHVAEDLPAGGRALAAQKGPNLIATAKNMKIRQTSTVIACRGRVQRNHFG